MGASMMAGGKKTKTKQNKAKEADVYTTDGSFERERRAGARASDRLRPGQSEDPEHNEAELLYEKKLRSGLERKHRRMFFHISAELL